MINNNIKTLIKKMIRRNFPGIVKSNYGWDGSFSCWEDAEKECVGYNSDIILSKVKDALLKVKNGEAVYERDSVLFNKISYSWPLIANLMWIAAQNSNKLNIIDFGGSLGTTYFQNRFFLQTLDELSWNIIEQKKFVDVGKLYFEDENLKFFYNIEDCLKKNNAELILLSSVLQYLSNPYDFLKNIISYNFKYIIFDRTAFIYSGDDRITVQKVPPEIYSASYPAWFFNIEKFIQFFEGEYELICDFEAYVGSKYHINDYTECGDKGFVFKKVGA